jgi:hypothetical protein
VDYEEAEPNSAEYQNANVLAEKGEDNSLGNHHGDI